MNIRNVGAALRGAGDAAMNHEQQQRLRNEETFRQKQRAEQEGKWADEAKLKTKLKGIPAIGAEYEEPGALAPDEMGPAPAKKGVQDAKRYYNQLAGVYQNEGDPKAALDIRRAGQQEMDADFARHQRDTSQLFLQASRVSKVNPRLAMQMLAKAYEKDNDGYKIVVEGDNWGVAGPNAQWTQRPTPVTKEAVDAMILQGLNYLSEDSYRAMKTRELKEQEIGIQQGQLGVAQQRAGFEGDRVAMDKELNPARRGLLAAQTNAANASASQASAAASRGRVGSPVLLTDGKGNTMQAYPVIDPATNKVTYTQTPFPEGWGPPKQDRRAMADGAVAKMVADDPELAKQPELLGAVHSALLNLGQPDPDLLALSKLTDRPSAAGKGAPAARGSEPKNEEKKRGVLLPPNSIEYGGRPGPAKRPTGGANYTVEPGGPK